MTVVQPPATHDHAGSTAKHHAGSTAKRDHKRWAANGRHHGLHALHSTPSGNH